MVVKTRIMLESYVVELFGGEGFSTKCSPLVKLANRQPAMRIEVTMVGALINLQKSKIRREPVSGRFQLHGDAQRAAGAPASRPVIP